jgi:hypothetical protein
VKYTNIAKYQALIDQNFWGGRRRNEACNFFYNEKKEQNKSTEIAAGKYHTRAKTRENKRRKRLLYIFLFDLIFFNKYRPFSRTRRRRLTTNLNQPGSRV